MSHRIYTEFKDLNTHFDNRNFFVSKNLLLLGNTDGWFSNEFDWAYNSVSGERWYKGLYYRVKIDRTLKTFIVGDSETIAFYKNLFSKWELDINKDYDFPNTNKNVCFVTIDEWLSDRKTNIFERYINYVKEIGVHFNHIIANPPYSLGNQITATVLNNVDFDEYVNLMPVSKYKKNKIYQHIKPNSLTTVTWDGDAATNPQIAELTKTRDTNVSDITFNVWCYNEKELEKFYLINPTRTATFRYLKAPKNRNQFNMNTDFMVTTRTIHDGVHKMSKSADYKFNLLKDDSYIPYDITNKCFSCNFLLFKTEEEKINFSKWWYSNNGNNLMNRILKGTGMQCGSIKELVPKVDWSHEWTDEEILKDYGYTDEEIKELLK